MGRRVRRSNLSKRLNFKRKSRISKKRRTMKRRMGGAGAGSVNNWKQAKKVEAAEKAYKAAEASAAADEAYAVAAKAAGEAKINLYELLSNVGRLKAEAKDPMSWGTRYSQSLELNAGLIEKKTEEYLNLIAAEVKAKGALEDAKAEAANAKAEAANA